MTARIFLLVILAIFATAVAAQKNPKASRKELDKIKKQLQETNRKVDSLKKLEDDLEGAISKYSDRLSRNRKVVGDLEKKLGSVRGRLSENLDVMSRAEERLARLRDGYVSFLVDYYRRRGQSGSFWPGYDHVMQETRLTRYLAVVSGQSTQEMVLTVDSVRRLSRSVDSLEQTGTVLDRQRKQKKASISLDMTLKKKEESSLGKVRRQAGMLEDRLASLSEAAKQMEEVIARVEKSQKEKAARTSATKRKTAGTFEKLKGSLSPPIKGRIVTNFGWKENSSTKLKMFSPGIDILPAKGQTIVGAAASGRVAYVGNLRGYDNFVILAHDDGYYTTYAGMTEILVEENELIEVGGKLGRRGQGPIRFEIRREREHVDPMIWLDTNEL